MIRLPAAIYVARAPVNLHFSFDRLAGIVRYNSAAILGPTRTVAALDPRQRAIVAPLWERDPSELSLNAPRRPDSLARAAARAYDTADGPGRTGLAERVHVDHDRRADRLVILSAITIAQSDRIRTSTSITIAAPIGF